MSDYPNYSDIIQKLSVSFKIDEKENFKIRFKQDLTKLLNDIEYSNNTYKIERPYIFYSKIMNTLNRFDILVHIDQKKVVDNDYYNMIKEILIEESKTLNENNYKTSQIFNKANKFIGISLHFFLT
jgi:hypothetical protein